MRQATRRFPFAALGLVLIAISAAPLVIGMERGFNEMQRGENGIDTVNRGVELAWHPAFMACGIVGCVLVFVGIILAARRAGRAAALREISAHS
jgi:hypothetical protein